MEPSHELVRPSSISTGEDGPMPRYERAALAFLTRYRRRTFQSYKNDLTVFFRWCLRRGIDPLEIDRTGLELYIRWMESPDAVPATKTKPARPYERNSVARRFGAVVLYYRYAVIDDYIIKNPCDHVRRPTALPYGTGSWVELDELRLLLKSARAVELWPSEYALICLLGFNALRISEVLAIDLEHFSEWDGYHQVAIVGKGDQPDTITLSPTTTHACKMAAKGREAGPLLLGRWGARMSECAARDVIDRHAKATGISNRKRITPHSFRRGSISIGLDAGVPLRDVQRLARHKDPRVTARYDRSGHHPAQHATHLITAHVAAGLG